MATVYLGLGANVGNRMKFLQNAFDRLAQQFYITASSSVYETEPWGEYEQHTFLNAVIAIETMFFPLHLFNIVKEIEQQTGRSTSVRWKEREIDIDILLFDAIVMCNETLQIPHKFLHERKFVLIPLSEIAPAIVHPIFHKTMTELLRECTDSGNASKTNLYFKYSPPRVGKKENNHTTTH